MKRKHSKNAGQPCGRRRAHHKRSLRGAASKVQLAYERLWRRTYIP